MLCTVYTVPWRAVRLLYVKMLKKIPNRTVKITINGSFFFSSVVGWEKKEESRKKDTKYGMTNRNVDIGMHRAANPIELRWSCMLLLAAIVETRSKMSECSNSQGCNTKRFSCWTTVLIKTLSPFAYSTTSHISPSEMLPAARQAKQVHGKSTLHCAEWKFLEIWIGVFLLPSEWVCVFVRHERERESIELAGKWPTINHQSAMQTNVDCNVQPHIHLIPVEELNVLPRALLFFAVSHLFESFVRSFVCLLDRSYQSRFVIAFGFCVCKQIEYEFSYFSNRMRITPVFGNVFSYFSRFNPETFIVRLFDICFFCVHKHSLVSFRFDIRLQAHITVDEEKEKKKEATLHNFRLAQVTNLMITEKKE